MMTTKQDKTTYHVFDSVEDMIDSLTDQVAEDRWAEHDYSRRRSFIGRYLRDWNGVCKAARNPWADGIEVLDRMLRDLGNAQLPKPKSRRRRTRFSEDNGDEVDYDRLRDGRAFWRSSRRESTRGPATVTVLVDVGANCNVDHQNILWRGAAAIALTKRLEEAGYRIELWAVQKSEHVWSSRRAGGRWDLHKMDAVCLKRPGEPLDPSTLISTVSGWFFRTVFFRSNCLGDRPIRANLGISRTPSPSDLDKVSRDPGRIVIAGAFTYSDAVEKVRTAIAKLTE